MIAFVVLFSLACLGIAYVTYGRWLARRLSLDDACPTPACKINDGLDYVPAKPFMLLGQHFSAIAAAGPIVGPILAGIWFGWLPALVWIILGSIFIGGMHDFSSLVGSVRHGGTSIGELVKRYISPRAHTLFLGFVWVALVYVIIAFTDITSQTFTAVSQGSAFGPAVALSSGLYLLLSLVMGLVLRHFKVGLGVATLIFLPLVLLIVWLGPHLPSAWLAAAAAVTVKQWDVILLIYCFAASLIPVWLLLQPRGYLGGWLLYLTIAVAFTGALAGGLPLQYPAVNLAGLSSALNGKWMFPVLFITVACGACSGFHGIVSSGTTSKQLQQETDAKPVGYGAMLLEALVAVLALATLMILSPSDALLKGDPNMIYAHGLARYLGLIGVNYQLALAFALLAFSTFVYDTLDVCTRLARYILQELTGWQSPAGALGSTLITLLVPLAVLLTAREKAYLVAWPIFGSSNQLMASLTLLAVSAWLIKSGKHAWHAWLPMGFMLVVTVWSLFFLIRDFLQALFHPALSPLSPSLWIGGVTGIVLVALSAWLLLETVRAFSVKSKTSG